ncbi:hypothetical protein THAOC_29756, partial [Thalassiosira oceanica]
MEQKDSPRNSHVASIDIQVSDVVAFHGRTQLGNNASQISIDEMHLFDMVALANIFKESIRGASAAAIENAASINAKLIQTCALLREMTKPAELRAA